MARAARRSAKPREDDPAAAAAAAALPPPPQVVWRPVDALEGYPGNANQHPQHQVDAIGRSLAEFGWLRPALLDGFGGIIAGHGTIAAARALWLAGGKIPGVPDGLVPCIEARGLTDAQKRAYVHADNQLPKLAVTDAPLLAAELEALQAIDFPLAVIGFSDDDLDALRSSLSEVPAAAGGEDSGDEDVAAADAASTQGRIVVTFDEANRGTVTAAIEDAIRGLGLPNVTISAH